MDSPGVCSYDPRDSLNVGNVGNNSPSHRIGSQKRFFERSEVTKLKQRLPHAYQTPLFQKSHNGVSKV